ncbi:MAG: hypothetical protein Q9170_003018 [Blastenia crenularia]
MRGELSAREKQQRSQIYALEDQLEAMKMELAKQSEGKSYEISSLTKSDTIKTLRGENRSLVEQLEERNFHPDKEALAKLEEAKLKFKSLTTGIETAYASNQHFRVGFKAFCASHPDLRADLLIIVKRLGPTHDIPNEDTFVTSQGIGQSGDKSFRSLQTSASRTPQASAASSTETRETESHEAKEIRMQQQSKERATLIAQKESTRVKERGSALNGESTGSASSPQKPLSNDDEPVQFIGSAKVSGLRTNLRHENAHDAPPQPSVADARQVIVKPKTGPTTLKAPSKVLANALSTNLPNPSSSLATNATEPKNQARKVVPTDNHQRTKRKAPPRLSNKNFRPKKRRTVESEATSEEEETGLFPNAGANESAME